MGKRTYNLDQASSSESFKIPVDNENYTEAKHIDKNQLFYDGVIEGPAAADKDIAASNYSFANTNASESRFGTIKTADNTTASELTDSEKALVSSNIPSIFEAIMDETNTYTISDLDSAINCTLDSISYWSETVAGNIVFGEATFTITIPLVTNDVTILMNIPNLPKNLAVVCSGAYPEPSLGDKYFAMGVIIGVDTGKLSITMTKDANSWNNGTYQVGINYRYLKS